MFVQFPTTFFHNKVGNCIWGSKYWYFMDILLKGTKYFGFLLILPKQLKLFIAISFFQLNKTTDQRIRPILSEHWQNVLQSPYNMFCVQDRWTICGPGTGLPYDSSKEVWWNHNIVNDLLWINDKNKLMFKAV